MGGGAFGGVATGRRFSLLIPHVFTVVACLLICVSQGKPHHELRYDLLPVKDFIRLTLALPPADCLQPTYEGSVQRVRAPPGRHAQNFSTKESQVIVRGLEFWSFYVVSIDIICPEGTERLQRRISTGPGLLHGVNAISVQTPSDDSDITIRILYYDWNPGTSFTVRVLSTLSKDRSKELRVKRTGSRTTVSTYVAPGEYIVEVIPHNELGQDFTFDGVSSNLTITVGPCGDKCSTAWGGSNLTILHSNSTSPMSGGPEKVSLKVVVPKSCNQTKQMSLEYYTSYGSKGYVKFTGPRLAKYRTTSLGIKPKATVHVAYHCYVEHQGRVNFYGEIYTGDGISHLGIIRLVHIEVFDGRIQVFIYTTEAPPDDKVAFNIEVRPASGEKSIGDEFIRTGELTKAVIKTGRLTGDLHVNVLPTNATESLTKFAVNASVQMEMCGFDCAQITRTPDDKYLQLEFITDRSEVRVPFPDVCSETPNRIDISFTASNNRRGVAVILPYLYDKSYLGIQGFNVEAEMRVRCKITCPDGVIGSYFGTVLTHS